MSLIEIQNLEKTYLTENVETPALRGVSLNIKKGEFISIMGPSGCGKSTLLHILGVLDEPTKGKYLFDGKNIERYSNEEIAHLRNKKMGFVFQAFNLLPQMTVFENIKLPLLYSDVKQTLWDNMVMEAIERLGLSHRKEYKANKLSGGEKQRVAIARALVNNPEIIFADEPTGNLDSKSGRMIMDYIDKFHNDGWTVILVTHETYTAQYAERIIKLKDGIIESDEIINPKDRRKDGFLK